jgi:hypothetical protein
MEVDKQPSLCFIIACKVYKNYQSYIPKYIDNINLYYPGAKIILVDNNSVYKEFYEILKNIYPDVIILENTSESKFEVGAYKFATEYIINNNLHYDYYICTQDTFILVNKYNFNELVTNNIKAASLGHFYFHRSSGLHIRVLSLLGIYDPNEEFLCCWCSSWVCDHKSLLDINIMLKNIIPTTRYESMESERYMGKILKILNNNVSYSIEKGVEGNNYDCHSIDLTSEDAKKTGNYFIKRAQQKNENTPEI